MKVGRPSKYDPSKNDTVIELMSEGASLVEVADFLDVDRKTIWDWCNEDSPRYKDEFCNVIKRGYQKCQVWWEKQGRANLQNKDFSWVGWFMNMKNRFPEDWRDKKEVENKTEITGGSVKIIAEGEDPETNE